VRPIPQDRRTALLAFAAVTTLFFAWGFITSNNDPLIVALRAAFALSYTEALLTQIIFFLAYGLLSLPAAWISSRIGPTDTINAALLLMVCGCLLVAASTSLGDFRPTLAALFVLAAGFTTLQVAANPLAASLGRPEGSHVRLNLAQSFNSIGVVLGVHFGSLVMLRAGQGTPGGANQAELLDAVDQAYLIMAAMLGLLLLMMVGLRKLLISAVPVDTNAVRPAMFEAIGSRWAIFGATAIGLYVGAEVSIGSIMINFLNQPGVMALPYDEAGRYLANFYWGGALAGRLIGTLLLTRLPAPILLAACAVMASALCALVLLAAGPIGGYAALAVGLFNSIMFPTIFSLTLERSGVSQSATSGLLCLAIFGGALLPLAVGAVADAQGLAASFAIPLVAYIAIASFALAARKARLEAPAPAIAATGSPLP
jgi:FHS family L-fucose permease-like MFS transporter